MIRTITELDLPEYPRLLDAGSGQGLVLFWLAMNRSDYLLHGIELDPGAVTESQVLARRMGLSSSITFEQGDLVTIDILKASYDLVFSIDVLEHIDEDVRVLQKLRESLTPDGVLLLHLPLRHQEQDRIFPMFRNHTIDDHVRDEYLPSEIKSRLDRAGFETRDLRYGFGWTGELAFELNNLFWNVRAIRALVALLTYPLAWLLAYLDLRRDIKRGNSLIIKATPKSAEREQ